MLHEVLTLLSGFDGGLFLYDAERHNYFLTPDLPFVAVPETSLIQRACTLASTFKQLNDFVTAARERDFDPKALTRLVIRVDSKYEHPPPKPSGYSMFMDAIASGINEQIQSYRLKIISIEQELIADPTMSLTHVLCSLSSYEFVFPMLQELVQCVVGRDAFFGGRLLDIVQRHTLSGVKEVNESAMAIFAHCKRLLFRNVRLWICHGICTETADDFFIKQTTSEVNTFDENFWFQHSLNLKTLPSFLPVNAAEKILFIGKAVQILSQLTSKKVQNDLNIESLIPSEDLHTMESMLGVNLIGFEQVVEQVRSRIAKALWSVLVNDLNLIHIITTMKSFFLLGNGEVFQLLLDDIRGLLLLPPTPPIAKDIHTWFQHACARISDSNTIKVLESLRMELPLEQSEDDWTLLTLRYKPEWPLNAFFSSSIMEKYQKLFKFLFFLKRVQSSLQQLWCPLMQFDKHVVKQNSSLLKKNIHMFHLVRDHMSFLIDNLQYYVHVDIIEVQFAQLLEKMQSHPDFESLVAFHSHYLSTLLNQCLSQMNVVDQSLHDIFRLCLAFCNHINTKGMQHLDFHFLDQTVKDYERQTNFLFTILSGVEHHSSTAHLSQLLLRLDYNGYFTKRTQAGTASPLTFEWRV